MMIEKLIFKEAAFMKAISNYLSFLVNYKESFSQVNNESVIS
jgi:hypothetical protein